MSENPGSVKVRIFQSALKDVKYYYGKPIPWTGHEDAIRHHNNKDAKS